VITRFHAILLVGVVAATLQQGLRRWTRPAAAWASRRGFRAATALLAAGLVLAASVNAGSRLWHTDYRYDVGVPGKLAAVIRRHSEPGDPVMFLHTGVPPTYPMLAQMDRRSGTRFMPLAPLALLLHRARPSPGSPLGFVLDADAREEERRFLAELREDIERKKPKLIFIDARNQCDQCPPGVGVERYLRVRRFIPEALADYRELPREGAFAVYVRREPDSPSRSHTTRIDRPTR
jgi:hypothetical protein